MELRKTAVFFEEVNSEYGGPVRPPLRRVAVGAVFKNPLLDQPASASLQPLIDLSCELGEPLTKRALSVLGEGRLRSYTKGALVGTAGAVEHGAALIHPHFGMAMRKAIRRGRVLIPGHAKIGAAGTPFDLLYGPIDEGWDLDAIDSMQVVIPDAPRPDEIVLFVGYASGPRANARCKGPDQAEVDALVASFAHAGG
jgi:hypothetical protein